MITLRRSEERHHIRRRRHELWLTFHSPDRGDLLADGFGALEILTEEILPPGAAVPRLTHRDADIVSYVHEGALAHDDGTGQTGIICAGEFERRTAGRSARRSETNASRTHWAHVFHMCLRPSRAELPTSHEQKRFYAAERRGALRVVASPDGRHGSLRVHEDALIHSALFDPGQHVVHALRDGRCAWLHVVRGEATLGDLILATGDGAGIARVPAVSLTALTEAEILLVDVAEPTSRSNNGAP